MSLVSFVQTRKNLVKAAIAEALDLIDYRFAPNIRRIVIKANMCYYWDYSTGLTTDPKFVGALIDVIRERVGTSLDISVVESDASAMKCKHAFKYLGYEKLAHDYSIRLVNLSEDMGEKIRVSVKGQAFNFVVPDTIKNADLKINVAKIKYSGNPIKITCALKNIFGCNPFPKKYLLHPKLSEAIVALNKIMKFDLCLIDDNIACGATTRKLGLVMASRDAVAVDMAAAKIAGVNPKSVPYIKMAYDEGIGNSSYIAKGLPLEHFRRVYPRKGVKNKLMDKAHEYITLLKLGKRIGIS